jgi:4-hydroxybenzoate polyprenyltransferase/phosphoserine phosphatase
MGEEALLSAGAGTARAAARVARGAPAQTVADVPLVVDLDGTLIRTDSLLESLFVLAKEHPSLLFVLPWWLAQGRARLKQQVAATSLPDVRTLPYHDDLLRYLQMQKAQGRRLVLATGADARLAHEVAGRLGLFDQVLASDGSTNLSGEAKRKELVAAFGERGFDYVGGGSRDVPVWRSARGAVLVDPTDALKAAVRQVTTVDEVLGDGRAGIGIWLRQLRWHHWLKNLLVFVPLLTGHRLSDPQALAQACLAFVGMCLAASSIYLLDDLVDLPRDRSHPHKKERPLASGDLPATRAVVVLALLWLGTVAVALMLPVGYRVVLAAYVVLMLAYVLRVHDVRVVDALLLGCGYTLRILAGSAAVGIAVSAWLLICSTLLFFSLALLKRFAELSLVGVLVDADARSHGYQCSDAPMVAALGRAAGATAMLVLALYPLAEPAVQPARWLIWGGCALMLYWMQRLWRLAGAGRIPDDPVMFALKDRRSLVAGAIVLALFVAAA